MTRFLRVDHLKPSHVVATVLCLFTMATPMTFALQRGRQIAKEEVRRILGGPLLQQITGMDVGEIEVNGDSITVTRSDGTCVFENISRLRSGDASVSASIFDADNNWVKTITFNRGIRVVDDNRIDFEGFRLP